MPLNFKTRHANVRVFAGAIAAVGFACMPLSCPAATYDVNAAGLWTAASTWSPNIAGGPGAADTIMIITAPTANVTLGGDPGTVYSVTAITHSGTSTNGFLPSAAVSNTGAKTLMVSGDIRSAGTGELRFSNNASGNGLTLSVGGNLLVDSGLLRLGVSNNNSAPTLTLAGSTVVQASGTLGLSHLSSIRLNHATVNGALTIERLTANSQTLTLSGLSGTGAISIPVDHTAAVTTTIVFDQTMGFYSYSGSLSEGAQFHSIALRKDGAGRQILSGALAYSGVTDVRQGVLQFDTVIPATTRITFSTGGGVLGLGAGNLSLATGVSAGQIGWANSSIGGFAAYNGNRSVTLNDGAVLTWGTNSFMGTTTPSGYLVLGSDSADGTVSFTNEVKLNGAARRIDVPDGPVRIEAELSGQLSNGGLTKTGAGVLRLTGSNTFTSAMQVQQGVVLVDGGGSVAANYFLNGGVIGLGNEDLTRALGTSTGQVRLQADGSGFAAFNGDRTVNIGNGTNLTWGTTANFFTATPGASTMVLNVAESDAKLTFANNLNLSGTRTIVVGNGSAAVDAALTGILSGVGSSLVKAGGGTLELTAANTFSGGTQVDAGTLLVTAGDLNASAVTVAAGAAFRYNSASARTGGITLAGGGAGVGNRAMLSGTGVINTALALDAIGDTLSPGNSPGILPFATGQTWSSFTYLWETNNFTGIIAGTDFDRIDITGSLALTGGSGAYLLDITSLTATNATGLVPNFIDADRSWTILTTTTGISGFDPSAWTISTANFTSSPAATGVWNVQVAGNDLVLNYVAVVPEPAGWLLLASGLGVVVVQATRRRSARRAA
jgi:autotransporter-associated beta strand protein